MIHYSYILTDNTFMFTSVFIYEKDKPVHGAPATAGTEEDQMYVVRIHVRRLF